MMTLYSSIFQSVVSSSANIGKLFENVTKSNDKFCAYSSVLSSSGFECRGFCIYAGRFVDAQILAVYQVGHSVFYLPSSAQVYLEPYMKVCFPFRVSCQFEMMDQWFQGWILLMAPGAFIRVERIIGCSFFHICISRSDWTAKVVFFSLFSVSLYVFFWLGHSSKLSGYPLQVLIPFRAIHFYP